MSEHDDESQQVPLLDDDTMDELFEFLDSEHVDPDALTLFGAHGFLVALAISPQPIASQVWIAELFNGEPEFANDEQREQVLNALEQLHQRARAVFEGGDAPELPFDLEVLPGVALLDTPVGEWCAGFMSAVFMHEDAWFEAHEEDAAQLLLPFMALSELFEEEDEDLAALARSPQDATRLARQLPELALDLYLLYRVPKEKPKPPSRPKRQRKKR